MSQKIGRVTRLIEQGLVSPYKIFSAVTQPGSCQHPTSSPTFKPGDVVECVDARDTILQTGELYIIEHVGSNIILKLGGVTDRYLSHRFILAQACEPPAPVDITGYIRCNISRIGCVRPSTNGYVRIYLYAEYWPDDKRDGREGEQYMGEFLSFRNFKNSGSFDDLEFVKT